MAASQDDISARAREAALHMSISKCLASDNYDDSVALGEALWKLLTPEQQDELVADWSLYDNNNDASITMAEYKDAEIKWYKAKFNHVPMEEVCEKVEFFFKYRDINSDNEVGWMEWMETKAFLLLDMNNQLQNALTEHEETALTGLFRVMDADGDGRITLGEAKEYYTAKVEQMITIGMVPMLDYYAKQEYVSNKVNHFFRFHDRDNNEFITQDEFNAEEAKFVILDRFRKAAHASTGSVLKFEKELQDSADLESQPLVLDKQQLEHARLKFAEYDVDGNGISRKELAKLLKDLNMHVKPKELKNVRKKAFRASDKDHDGLLDFHEFIAVYSFFLCRSLDFDVFMEAQDGIGVDEDGDGVVDTYLKNSKQTEMFIAGMQHQRLDDLDEEFDSERHKVGYVYKNGTYRYSPGSDAPYATATQEIEIKATPRPK